MASELHAQLVALGANWLRRQGFPVVATELSALGCREQADVVGFRSSCSAIVEVKVSRADFLADARKPERAGAKLGIGNYRFYLCPAGLVTASDLPAGWGLLYGEGRRVQELHRPLGNIWPGEGTDLAHWSAFHHAVDARAERAVLFSIARRSAQKKRLKNVSFPLAKRVICSKSCN